MTGYVINMDNRPDKLERFYQNKFPFEVIRIPGVKSENGVDGCTEAHLSVLRLKHTFPFVVFEDDCKLVHSWEVVNIAMKQLPNEWDALWLGANLRKPIKQYSKNLYTLKCAYALHAVIYNSQGMIDHILQNHNTPSGTHLDRFYRWNVQYNFKCFLISPMVAMQEAGINDVSGVYTDSEEHMLNQFKKYALEIYR